MAKRVYSETEILEKIKRRPSYISKVEQTPERAMLAVNTDFRSIQLIDEQHRDFQVCMIAVQHGYHMMDINIIRIWSDEVVRRGQELIQAENTMATGIEGYLSESC